MGEALFNEIEKWDLIYALIGGGLGFIVVWVTSVLIFDPNGIGAVYWSLASLGILGIISFQEQFALASAIMQFGIVHLLGGFCGGLYTGYKVEKKLKFLLIIPGIATFLISFLIFIASTYFQGGAVNLSTTNLLGTVILPITGNLTGSYLGGYAINWPTKEETEKKEPNLT